MKFFFCISFITGNVIIFALNLNRIIMKLRFYLASICFVILCITSCKKDIKDEPQPSNFNTESIDNNIIDTVYIPKEVYNILAIKFNYPIDTVFRMKVDGIENTFRVFTDLNCETKPLSEVETYIYNHDSILFITPNGLWGDSLQPDYNRTVTLSVSAELEILINNGWKKLTDKEGRKIKEVYQTRFFPNYESINNPYDFSIKDLTKKYHDKYILPTTTSFIFSSNNFIDAPIVTNPYVKVQLFIDSISFKENQEQLLDFEFENDNNSIFITPKKPLSPETEYNIALYLGFKLKTVDSDWLDIGKKITCKTAYKTSLAYNENDFLLEYSYPALNQYHFLKDEYPKGYMRFSKMPEEIKQGLKRKENTYFVRISKYNTTYYADAYCTYSPDSLYFEYNMPSDFLENEAVYTISLHSLSLKGEQTKYYTYFFRTSKFNNAISKFNDYSNIFCTSQAASGGHVQIMYIYPVTELLDYWECLKDDGFPEHNIGLIQMEILPDESSIFQINDYKTLYEKLAQYPQALKWRTPEMMGIPPVINTGFTKSDYYGYHPGYLTPELIEQGAGPIPLEPSLIWRINCFYHNFSRYASQDYFDLKQYLQAQGEELDLLIVWFTNNNLMFNANYVLPGINVITSSKKYNYSY